MLIIIDRKAPKKARQSLSRYGEVVGLATSAITYEAISGHPDIFLCQCGSRFIVAPNLPREYLEFLVRKGVPLKMGKNKVGSQYPASARYNAVVTDEVLIHHLDLTDPVILGKVDPQKRIHVSQGYCRCNLISLGADNYITSDAGIQKVLAGKGFHVLYVDPAGILLPGFPHGFIGGACGILGRRIFFIGSLQHYAQGDAIREFIRDLRYEVVELYYGPLFDGGGVMFVE